LWDLNLKDGTLTYNERWAEMLGYQLDEVAGDTSNWDTLMHPDDKESVLQTLQRHLDGEIPYYEFEYRMRTKSGRWKWVFDRGQVVERDERGNPLRMTGTHFDVTRRKNSEVELKKMTAELLRSNTELKQFAYIISHNLRAPIVNMQGLLSLYDSDFPAAETNEKIIDKTRFSVQQLSNTLDDLTRIIAIKNKSQDQPCEHVDFEVIFTRVQRSIEHQIKEADARIEWDFSEAPTIFFPAGYLQSILLNLLTNAIKYRSPNRRSEVFLNTALEKEYAVLRVSDNGIGIDLELYGKQVFGMYKRFHEHVDGKGLGLYIVRSQVEAFGGFVEVESKLDKGTVFKVFLKN